MVCLLSLEFATFIDLFISRVEPFIFCLIAIFRVILFFMYDFLEYVFISDGLVLSPTLETIGFVLVTCITAISRYIRSANRGNVGTTQFTESF